MQVDRVAKTHRLHCGGLLGALVASGRGVGSSDSRKTHHDSERTASRIGPLGTITDTVPPTST